MEKKVCKNGGNYDCDSIFLGYQQKQPRVVGTVTEIYVHPLKSGRGIKVNSAFAGEQGNLFKQLLQFLDSPYSTTSCDQITQI